MDKAGFTPLFAQSPVTFQDLALLNSMYADLTGRVAWKDYQAHIRRLRDGYRQALEVGALDKYGKGHDDEFRAVIHVLNSLLLHVPGIAAKFEKAEKGLKGMYGVNKPEGARNV